jgi:serine/threonine protein kinase
VELLPTGEVVKSPWTGPRAKDCRKDITTEFEIYTRLGPHPRLVLIIDWDPEECVLTMEHMSNGSLKDFILARNDSISMPQRLQWAREAAEGLQLLHTANLIHCDINPKNFLLDNNLNLKIADFSGSSLDGYQPSACASDRFLLPGFDWRRQPVAQDDLFGLGSLIYFIMTGQYLFQELASDEVQVNYKAHSFPDVRSIECGDIIKQCWNFEAGTVQNVIQYLQERA